MWFMAFAFILLFNMRPSRATWGKWRIPYGKGERGSVFMFKAPKVVAPACVDYGPCRLGLEEQALIMY
jgi:hypothetical protein